MTKLVTIAAVKAAMLEKVSNSLLDPADATKLKFKPLTAADTKTLDVPIQAPGFLIPYFTIDGKPSKFWRLRYLEDTRKGFGALSGRKSLRYVQAKGGVNEVYLAPFVDWRRLAETPEIPLIITEGELKAACVTKVGLPAVGLGGVFCFKSAKNKETLLPMLREFTWKARQVLIAYDSDAVTNPMVVLAENQLAKLLTDMGAVVKIVRIPPAEDNGKQGLDDYLLANDVEDLKLLLDSATEYAECKALHEMNQHVAYIRNPGFVYDYQNQMRLGCKDFTGHAYSNYWYEEQQPLANGGTKTIQHFTAQKWMQWGGRTELESCTFAPGHDTIFERQLNLWTGWGVEPAKGDIKPWKDLLDHLFGGSEPASRKWFEQWCAYPLQHPGAKMATAAVFWGVVQGSGKTLVGHTLMRIYGKHGSEITDAEIEDDRFDWAENMQFILADDITASNNRKLANRLKTMITQKTLKINQKYIPRYTVPDCINYYFTSNDPDAFYLDDGDRRYFIHEVRNDKLEVNFRKSFIKWRDEGQAGIQALFNHLLSLDTTDFDPQAEAYVTAAKAEMAGLTKSDIGSWVADIRNETIKLKLKGDLFTSAELLAEYDPMGAGRVTANGIARELKRAGFRSPGQTGSMAKTKHGNLRLYAIYNKDEWKDATMRKIIDHYEHNREMVVKKPPKF